MNKETKTCPSCGEVVEAEEQFCPQCGENLSEVPTDKAASAPAEVANRTVQTGGGRNNVMGDNIVNAQDQSTTNNIDNSQTTNHRTVNNVRKTSVTNQQTVGSIDNSQQVINNITIIGGAGMTLPGGITIPEAPAQPSVEQGVTASPQPSPEGKGVTSAATNKKAPAAAGTQGSKGLDIGVDEKGDVIIKETITKSSLKLSGKSKWLLVVVAVLAGGYYVWSHFLKSENNASEVAATAEVAANPTATAPASAAAEPASARPAASTAKSQATAPAQTPKTDANYEAGMKAYNAGDGLEAVRKFQASGTAEANYMLGVIYENGCGSVAANAMKARSFFKKAASQGSAEAKAKL